MGKQHILDRNPETCWTSQQGLPQYIQFKFARPVLPKQLSLSFQGGFVGTRCLVKIREPDDPVWKPWTSVYPEDINRRQDFDLTAELPAAGVEFLQLLFEESSDFFGRITVYDVSLKGTGL